MKSALSQILLAAIMFVSVTGQARQPNPSQDRFAQLLIDENSVKLLASEDLGFGDNLKITVGFRTLPYNSCQENYVGVFESVSADEKREKSYSVTYAQGVTEMCKQFGVGQDVSHDFYVKLKKPADRNIQVGPNTHVLEGLPQAELRLNGVLYRVIKKSATDIVLFKQP